MPIDLTAAWLIYLSPLAIAITLGLWLMLLGGLGFSEILGIPQLTSIPKRTVSLVVLIVSWGGALAILGDYYLLLFRNLSASVICIGLLLLPLRLFNLAFRSVSLTDWWISTPWVWTVLAVEGPLALLAWFGTPAIMRLFGITESRSLLVARRITKVLISTGIMTGLLGFVWPLWTAFANPDSLWDHIRLGVHLSPLLLSLCPVNLLLAVGLSVWLAVIGDRTLGTTTEAIIAAAITIATMIAGAIGIFLSILYVQSV